MNASKFQAADFRLLNWYFSSGLERSQEAHDIIRKHLLKSAPFNEFLYRKKILSVSPEMRDLFFPTSPDSRKFLSSLCCWIFDNVFDLLYEIMTITELFSDSLLFKRL